MSLYETWQQVAQSQQTQEAYNAFWATYFDAETKNYKKILANHDKVFSGKLSDLAKEFDMDPVTFTGATMNIILTCVIAHHSTTLLEHLYCVTTMF